MEGDTPLGGATGEPPESIAERTQRLIAEERAKEEAKAAVEKIEGSTEEELQDKQKRKDVILEHHKRLNPELDESKREAIYAATDKIDERLAVNAPLDDDDVAFLAGELGTLGLRQETEGVEKFIKAYSIPEDKIEAVKGKLPEMSEQERQDNNKKMGRIEAAAKGRAAETLRSTALKKGAEAQTNIDRLLAEANKEGDQGKVEELTKHKKRASSLLGKVQEIFTVGEQGREWAARVGKILYWAFIIMFLFIIWEMNAFNKMGRTK